MTASTNARVPHRMPMNLEQENACSTAVPGETDRFDVPCFESFFVLRPAHHQAQARRRKRRLRPAPHLNGNFR